MERENDTPETPKHDEKKAWVKPAATVEDVAKITKASNTHLSKSDGTTCQS